MLVNAVLDHFRPVANLSEVPIHTLHHCSSTVAQFTRYSVRGDCSTPIRGLKPRRAISVSEDLCSDLATREAGKLCDPVKRFPDISNETFRA